MCLSTALQKAVGQAFFGCAARRRLQKQVQHSDLAGPSALALVSFLTSGLPMLHSFHLSQEGVDYGSRRLGLGYGPGVGGAYRRPARCYPLISYCDDPVLDAQYARRSLPSQWKGGDHDDTGPYTDTQGDSSSRQYKDIFPSSVSCDCP